jgi:hypothetical protein
MNEFEVTIVNYFDREGVVAEIYYNRVQCCEIFLKKRIPIIQFYSNPQRKYWEFPFAKIIESFYEAKNRLFEKENDFESSQDPEQVNKLAEKILEQILSHPEKKCFYKDSARFGKLVEIYAPDMGGVCYTDKDDFIGFLEPKIDCMEKFDITIASLPDREHLVAEIFYEEAQWAEISEETENDIIIQFYSPPSQEYWEFPLNDAIKIIEISKKELINK